MINIEQQRNEAQNESISPQRLRELAVSEDFLTLEHIVKNPNVPPDVLQNLAGQFSEQTFKNPAIDLLLLANPDLLSGISSDSLETIAQTTASTNILAVLARNQHWRVRWGVAKNPETTIEILKQLAQDFNPYSRQEVAKNPKIDEEIITKILFYKHSIEELNATHTKGKRPITLTIDDKEYLIEPCASLHLDDNPLGNVASNPNLSLDIIEQLVSNILKILEWAWGINFVTGIVSNPNIRVSTLRWLSGEEYLKIHNDAVFEYHINSLASYKANCDPFLKKKSYQEIVSYLKKDWSVQEGASNSAMRLIGQLYWAIVQNPTTPEDLKSDLLLKLTSDKIIVSEVRYHIAKSLDVPVEILRRLAKVDPHPHKALAENPHTPSDVLGQLANHKDSDMRKKVVQHPSTLPETLEKLSEDEDEQVSKAAKANISRLKLAN